jgi:hypothetical protein
MNQDVSALIEKAEESLSAAKVCCKIRDTMILLPPVPITQCSTWQKHY